MAEKESSIPAYYHIREDLRGKIGYPFTSPAVLDEDNKFHTWYSHGGRLNELKPSNLHEGLYFARKPFWEGDYHSPFIDFILQRPLLNAKILNDTFPYVGGMWIDIYCFAASFAKLHCFHSLNKENGTNIDAFAVTEIEYIFNTSRSYFDLMQMVIRGIWDSIILTGSTRHKNTLPVSFREMIASGNPLKIRKPEELVTKFGIPLALAKLYIARANIFLKLKKYRDDIIHKGTSLPFIFQAENGFGIEANYAPFAAFGVWKEDTFAPNNIAPVKPIISFVVKETLDTADDFAKVLKTIFRFPEPLAPGYQLLFRGPHTAHLGKLKNYIDKDVWFK